MQLKRPRSNTVLCPAAGGPAELVVRWSDLTAPTTRWWVSVQGQEKTEVQLRQSVRRSEFPCRHLFALLKLSRGRIRPIHTGGSADSKAKLFRKHPETAFNQPSGAAVAWSSWPMKLDIIVADKEPSCLVPRESDTSPSRDQWHHVAEPELWAGSESTRQVTESMHVCWGQWGREPRH